MPKVSRTKFSNNSINCWNFCKVKIVANVSAMRSSGTRNISKKLSEFLEFKKDFGVSPKVVSVQNA